MLRKSAFQRIATRAKQVQLSLEGWFRSFDIVAIKESMRMRRFVSSTRKESIGSCSFKYLQCCIPLFTRVNIRKDCAFTIAVVIMAT